MDINAQPSQAAEAGQQVKPRRKKLSDVQGQTPDPLPEPKTQRKRLSKAAPTEADEPAPTPQPPAGRPRISPVQATTAVAEVLEDEGRWRVDDGMPAVAQLEKPAPARSHKDSAATERQIADVRTQPSLPIAAAGGFLAAVVGAMICAVVTVMTSVQIGWMAVGVGLLVGAVVRVLGRGSDKSFGYLGAGLALFSCLLGNYLTNCLSIAQEVGLSVTGVLTQVNPTAIPSLMIPPFQSLGILAINVLLHGFAMYEGYRFSFKRVAEA